DTRPTTRPDSKMVIFAGGSGWKCRRADEWTMSRRKQEEREKREPSSILSLLQSSCLHFACSIDPSPSSTHGFNSDQRVGQYNLMLGIADGQHRARCDPHDTF